ncbi:zinc metallochaperone AztD [Streptomyces sp. DSM 44915]|uniref:Zinc metallochaperone AztD n=1 Tax=Streptomyces chisholmiae TaxID=3075540 RepID=A0ABU2JNW2_9ACTN|nr:zinc metallochaperone AztD [Streptomyces sp. DSM 44915]MDT0266682.1 zinc metallochaperone AztD [Streptomyces sp. DSM 44915]
MRTSHLLRGGAAFAALALALTACGSDDTDESADQPADSNAAAEDAAGSTGTTVDHPLVLTYDGGLLVLDGETLEVAEDIPLDGFNRINPAGDDDHLLVSTATGFRVLDATGAELTEDEFPGEKPGHVVRHGGNTVLFADGTGEVTAFDPHGLGDGLPATETYQAAEAHHGVAVTLDSGELLVTLGTEESRSGAVVLAEDWTEEIARNEECPGVHGETVAQNEAVLVGCENGALIYQDGEFTKVTSPTDYGRIGNVAGSEESPIVLGDYKQDPDAELERPEQVSLVNTATGELELVDLGTSYTFRSLARGPHGEALVLGTDGALHVIDPETAEVTERIEVLGEWQEPLEWQQPRPALFVRDHTAFVTDPEEREIHAIDIESGEILTTAELPQAPNEISGVVHQH